MGAGLGMDRVVVIGAGQAGGAVCALLRQYGWTQSIALVGAEPVLPYQRPPLSKGWLKGDADLESIGLRPAAFYGDRQIELHLDATAVAIDRQRRRVRLASGECLNYGHLVLALGARSRSLSAPGTSLEGVLGLRTVADADALKQALSKGARLVVVGGGYVGLEVAASARSIGAHVTVIEREARLLSRVASVPLSKFFEARHRANGVAVVLSASVESVVGHGRVEGVRLQDGREFPCDVLLVGIGAVANDALAREVGLACDDGIIVDDACRTSDPCISAIGDCTRRPLPRYQRSLRLESVPNALEQARRAAADICRRAQPAVEVPWFWSTQYDLRLQIAGLPFDVTESMLKGSLASSRFAIFHLSSDGSVQAVEAVNEPAEFAAGRALIANREKTTRARLRAVALDAIAV
jgi:3-phenylpropionate/trans-cinnamate dioxygenase ferredoxin reductase component